VTWPLTCAVCTATKNWKSQIKNSNQCLLCWCCQDWIKYI